MSRAVKVLAQVLVSGGIVAYLLWRIDLGRTLELIASANAAYLVAALAIFVATTWGMAWRWQLLLGSKGIREPLGWLTSAYFVGYAAGQVLPTSVGGDAVRIVEHSRRRPGAKGEAAGAVLMERVLGSAGTLVLVAAGLAIAAGRHYEDLRLLVWLEAAFVAGVVLLGFLLFSRRVGRRLGGLARLAARVRLERAARSLYLAMHGYRDRPRVLVTVLGITVGLQLARVLAIWMCGEAVGIGLSPLVYVILGPLLFLVMMVPFTINGLGVREAFFIEFLGRFGVSPSAAFAAGFLFYAVTLATSIPGAVILLWRAVRPARAEAAA